MTAAGGSAAALVARASAVLFDFDGPICRLFAEVRSADVAADLRRYLQQHGAPVPDDGTGDPLAILRMSAGADDDVVAGLHAELVRAEVRAAATAVPTPHAHALIRGLAKSGHKVAIVTNNSVQAVREYLALHNLDAYISAISARTSADLLLMKPNPYFLERALSDLGVAASEAVFIGDSATDVEASIAAGAPCIGYANKSGKAERLAAAGAAEVIYSMSTFV